MSEPDTVAPATFDEGRYLYCAVPIDADRSIDVTGIDETPVDLLTVDDIGVLSHPVDSVYDSEDLTEVQGWLLSHQQVVDEAGERFGTPLPFRFDTIITGDDATVEDWVATRRAEIADALEWLAGRWEYRIELQWEQDTVREAVIDANEELSALADEIADAQTGTAYLLEKRFEQGVREGLADRRASVRADVMEAVEPHVVRIEQANAQGQVFGDVGADSAVRVTVLAAKEQEEAIGEALEDFAAKPAYEVRYTGPWPPYTFAPAIGEGDR